MIMRGIDPVYDGREERDADDANDRLAVYHVMIISIWSTIVR